LMFLKKVFQFRTKNKLNLSFQSGSVRHNFSSQKSSERTLPVPVVDEFSYLKPITETKADEILLDTFNLLNQNVQQLEEIGKLRL